MLLLELTQAARTQRDLTGHVRWRREEIADYLEQREGGGGVDKLANKSSCQEEQNPGCWLG